MPDVSFVATFYNKEEFIPKVTRALFAQKDLDNCEYIFVDDGSTDSSLSVLEECSKGHPNVKIIAQSNAGPALATNVGIDAARYPYIKFCDGDDILHPRATIELFKAMQMFGVDLAWSMGEVVSENSEKMQAPDLPLSKDKPELLKSPIHRALKMAFFNLTCVLVKTETARAAGNCDPRVFVQDYSFALRLAHLTDFAMVPSILNWCPAIDKPENRTSALSGGAQGLHDLNAALAYFIFDHPDLDTSIRKKILQRAAGRAWKWARRQEGASICSLDFLRYIAAKLAPNIGNTYQRTHATCNSFHPERGLRIPQKA